MLQRLVIHDVVLIDKLTLNLAPGLNIFTGETGAGKSILLDALGLALGNRSEAGLVRQGALQASVTAEFTLPQRHPALELAAEQGLSIDDALILRRVVAQDGKSRAFVNDQPISIGLLKQFGERLLEIHGQFETHGLLNPATHGDLLDAFGGLAALRNQIGQAYAQWKEAEQAYAEILAQRAQAQAEESFLREAVNELENLAPQTSEADDLATRRTALQHREKISDALQTAETALNGDRGAAAALMQAGKALARVADKSDDIQQLLNLVDQVADQTAEAINQLNRVIANTDAEPDALNKIEERLFALRAVARKHNTQTDLLPNLLNSLKNRLSLISGQNDKASDLEKQAIAAKKDYIARAQTLSDARKTTAQKFEKAITKELAPLKLDRARFTVELTALPENQWHANGMDRLVFLAATNPGSVPGPLHKVASGGELSRFMLALKVILAKADPVPTLVFDEVDAGIGGATASAVGERLAKLAEDVQILVVTHSPQVAARADNPMRVQKSVKGQQTFTEVVILSPTEQVEEIARMVAGNEVTDAARQAALSLIGNDKKPHKTAKRTTTSSSQQRQ